MNELNKSAFKTASYTIPSFYNSYLSSIEPDTVYDIDYTTCLLYTSPSPRDS